jgi:hypothetical protein
MSRSTRLLALPVLVLLSASPALPQARPGAVLPHATSWAEALREVLPDFVSRLWVRGQVGRSAVPSRVTPRSQSADLGCSIDPYGGCGTATQQTSGH